LLFNLPVVLREPFSRLKSAIEAGAGEALGRKISVATLSFRPYGCLILHDVRMYDEEALLYADAQDIHVRFKLLALLTDRTILITKLRFVEPRFFAYSKHLEVGQARATDSASYKLGVKRPLLIKAQSGKMVLGEGDSLSSGNYIGFDFWARLKEKGSIHSKGRIDLRGYNLKDYLINNIFFFEFVKGLRYELKTSLDGDNFILDKLLLDFRQFKIKIQGYIENYKTEPASHLSLSLKELNPPEKLYVKSRLFITNMRNFVVQMSSQRSLTSWNIRLDNIKGKFAYLPEVLKIDNFSCNLRTSEEGFFIDRVNCFLNNLPIGVSGSLLYGQPQRLDLQILSYPGQLASLKRNNPLNFKFLFSGTKETDAIKGDISLVIKRLISREPRKTREQKFEVSGFLCKFLDEESYFDTIRVTPLSISAEKIDYSADFPWQTTRFELTDLAFSLWPQESRINLYDLRLSAYGGALTGEGFLSFVGFPPKPFLDFEASDFDMAALQRPFI